MPPNLGGFFMVRSYYPSECHADYFDFERIVFFQAEDGIRDRDVTGVQTCALPIYRVGRTGRRDAHRAEAFSPQVLHGCEQPRRQHFNDLHARSNSANRSRETGTNLTRSPMERRQRPSLSVRNIARGERPSNLHPPGVSNGYTPVWLPAIPTLPAGTFLRGDSNRGVTNSRANSPR